MATDPRSNRRRRRRAGATPRPGEGSASMPMDTPWRLHRRRRGKHVLPARAEKRARTHAHVSAAHGRTRVGVAELRRRVRAPRGVLVAAEQARMRAALTEGVAENRQHMAGGH